MRLPYAMLGPPGAQPVRCYPGAIIGRLPSARLQFADPTLAEAAAIVSARKNGLYLLALRRGFLVGGRERWHVPLAAGLRVQLSANTEIMCAEVWEPPVALALSLDGGPPIPLSWETYALDVEADPWLAPAHESRANVWCDAGEFKLRVGTTQVQLRPGDELQLSGHTVSVGEVARPRTPGTLAAEAPEKVHLEVVARPHLGVVFQSADGDEIDFTERQQLLLAALAAERIDGRFVRRESGRVSWQDASKFIWLPRYVDYDEARMRKNFYNSLLPALQQRMRDRGVRDDCVECGNGDLWLNRALVDWTVRDG